MTRAAEGSRDAYRDASTTSRTKATVSNTISAINGPPRMLKMSGLLPRDVICTLNAAWEAAVIKVPEDEVVSQLGVRFVAAKPHNYKISSHTRYRAFDDKHTKGKTAVIFQKLM